MLTKTKQRNQGNHPALKLTKQRAAIISFLRASTEHPTLELIYENVKKELPKISLATIYRNLKELKKEGIIHDIKAGDKIRYDGNPLHHHHLICTSCNKIIDFYRKENLTLQNPETENFFPEEITIIARGLCSSCKKRGDTNG